jgi:hypothetical protein
MADKVSGNPNVFKEAKARKRGGKACAPEGKMAAAKMNRPRRASGGGVGSNKNPLSSAHSSCSAPKANN